MKRLLALIFVAGFVGCAQQPPPPAVTTGYPYSRYSTTAEVWGYRSGMYANWTTAQLQQRRLDGDKSADLIAFWPESRRHTASFRPVENF